MSLHRNNREHSSRHGTVAALLLGAMVFAPGCKGKAAAPAVAGKEAQPKTKTKDHHDHPSGVAKLEVVGVRKGKDQAGNVVLAAGKPLGADAKLVKTAAVRKAIETWLGKTVRLEGRVSAQCTKRRRWFSIVDDDSGRTIRVMTVPVFLAPRQVIGKKAHIVGKLERLAIPLSRARHMAKHHGLTPPDKTTIKGDEVHELVLRATGARFL